MKYILLAIFFLIMSYGTTNDIVSVLATGMAVIFFIISIFED